MGKLYYIYDYEELPDNLKAKFLIIVTNIASVHYCCGLQERIGYLARCGETPEVIRERIFKALRKAKGVTTKSRKDIADLNSVVFEVRHLEELENEMNTMKRYSQQDLLECWTYFDKFVQGLEGDFVNQELKTALKRAAKPTFAKISARRLELTVRQLNGTYSFENPNLVKIY
jgi:hypothetical protein